MDPPHDPPPNEVEEVRSTGWWRRLWAVLRHHRGWSLVIILTLGLALAMGSADAWLAGPMRTWAERSMNANLKGYRVSIARVRPHLWKLGFDLDGLTLVQISHPDPPVADFAALQFSVQVHELVRFKVAGDLTLQRPALHINQAQIEEEASSQVRLKDRGWQRAVESIFPFKLDRVRVREGSLLYLSTHAASKPLQLTRVSMVASNLRNIAVAKNTYPSPVTLEGLLFDSGKVRFDGNADFLCEPYVAAQGQVRLERVPLDRLTPFAQDYQLKTAGGFLSVDGWVEYTPEVREAHLREVLFEELRLDYVTSRATRALEREHARQVIRLAKRVRDAPKLLLRVDSLKLRRSQIGFENRAVHPPYRLFMAGATLEVLNLSNRASQGRTTFQGHGTFMGSGTTVISGGAQAAKGPVDFDAHLKLEGARLPDLNGFLLAHSGMDVAAGLLSAYAEVKVKQGRVEGYIKPLVKGLKIPEKGKDAGKSLGKRIEMRLLQFLSFLLKNHATQEVATVIRISGTTRDLETGGWGAIRKLVSNGLFRAIRPGFLPADPKVEAAKVPPSLSARRAAHP